MAMNGTVIVMVVFFFEKYLKKFNINWLDILIVMIVVKSYIRMSFRDPKTGRFMKIQKGEISAVEFYNTGYKKGYIQKHSEESKQKMRKPKSAEHKEKMSKSKTGHLNPQWKGDQKIHYASLHEYVRSHKQKPNLCEVCNIKSSLDLANITGIYNRDFENWKYMCRKCHMISDGRMNNLKQYQCGDKL